MGAMKTVSAESATAKRLASKFAGNYASEQNGGRDGERRNEADAAKGFAEDRQTDAAQKRDQGRLIHISPRQVSSANDVVEFVAKVSVAIVEEHVQQKAEGCNGYGGEHSVLRRAFRPTLGWITDRGAIQRRFDWIVLHGGPKHSELRLSCHFLRRFLRYFCCPFKFPH